MESQVNASVNRPSIPATASHFRREALERKPIKRATKNTTTSVNALEKSEVSTCAHNTDERLIGMVMNRDIGPLLISLNSRSEVRDAGSDRHQQDSRQQIIHVVVRT